MKTGLIIPCHNRPDYLRRCLVSLQQSDLSSLDHIVMIDDASTPSREFQQAFFGVSFPQHITLDQFSYDKNAGIKEAMRFGYNYLFNDVACEYVVNLDSDAIVTEHWLNVLLQIVSEFGDGAIVSGFNSMNKDGDTLRNPIVHETENLIEKKYCNGINMVMSRKIYEQGVYSFDESGNWDFNFSKQFTTIVPRNSVVQHIGLQSSMGHSDNPDVAVNFEELQLPTVTLFGIDAHDPEGITRAAEISSQHIKFGGTKIITKRLFQGREGYSKFCVDGMIDYIDTEHLLLIHGDGFVQNWRAWDNEFLKYDYIGATWWYKDNMNVGNGGFSLRSRKLLEEVQDIYRKTGINPHPEDHFICRTMRPALEERGIKFAPEEVANRFSIEAYNTPDINYNGQFGFHGYRIKNLNFEPAKKIK